MTGMRQPARSTMTSLKTTAAEPDGLGWHLGRSMAALGLAVACVACSVFPQGNVEPPRLHLLDAVPDVAVAAERTDLVLEVEATRAWAGFDTDRMAYVQKPHAIEYFANNRWAEPPARMLDPLLVRTLERSGGFRAVVQAPGPVPADLRLVVEIARLQQDFQVKPSQVEIALHLQLVDIRGRRLLASRTLEAVEAAPAEDAYGGATAANRALQRALEQVVAFCIAESATVARHPSVRP